MACSSACHFRFLLWLPTQPLKPLQGSLRDFNELGYLSVLKSIMKIRLYSM
jgi:hypothetical protein